MNHGQHPEVSAFYEGSPPPPPSCLQILEESTGRFIVNTKYHQEVFLLCKIATTEKVLRKMENWLRTVMLTNKQQETAHEQTSNM